MNKSDLKENLVCYWQDGGWHGCDRVITFNQRFVYYVVYDSLNKKPIEKKIYRKALSTFLNSHNIFSSNCEYAGFHLDKKNQHVIGRIIPPQTFE